MPDTFEEAFVHAPIGMAMVDMSGQSTRVNEALCRMTGYTAEQVCARPFSELSDPLDVNIDAAQVADLLSGRVPAYQVEKRFRTAWGQPLWVLLNVSVVRDANGQPLHMLAHVQDIAERKALEGSLARLVDHDALTGLFNRRRFEQSLAQETKTAARYRSGGALLMIDLDHFKDVNDRFGHKAGDDLLKTIASTLSSRIRGTDVLARLGGDEFAVILPQVDAARAEIVADSLVKALRQTATLGKDEIPVTASIGVAMFDALSSVELLAAADLAMYSAKDTGGDRCAFYQPTVASSPRQDRLSEAERIQRALAQDRLELFCQPIVDLVNSRVTQYELFVRLRMDKGELLPPGTFLRVAERFGTIASIDAWVVQQAVALIAAQAAIGRALTLHVNISAKSFGQPQLLAAIDHALTHSRIDPASLVFEFNEASALANMERAKSFTNDLRSRGCRLALDDFTTGFGSFQHVKQLSFDYLKIDGDFIARYGDTPTDQLILEAVVWIARALRKKTIAEGVTSQDLMDRLHSSGVDYAQGFHSGVPRPVGEVFSSGPDGTNAA